MASGGKKLTNRNISFNTKELATKTRIDFTVSFQYFRQIEYFGIGDKDNKWFVGVIERLKDFCGQNSNLLENYNDRNTYRLHRINWNQPNIPIKRENLEWLPSSYLNNPEEYPIWQFEISKSTGRIIGFFNENSTTFYILLLDPNHNMQPCSTYGYKIDDTKVGLTEIEYIEQKLSMLRRKSINCKVENCALNTVFPPKMGGYIYIDEELMRKYEELLRDGRFYELFDSFLLDKL